MEVQITAFYLVDLNTVRIDAKVDGAPYEFRYVRSYDDVTTMEDTTPQLLGCHAVEVRRLDEQDWRPLDAQGVQVWEEVIDAKGLSDGSK